eukprot:364838-Chlamydomonas_euryale.AAC.2
MHMLSIDCWVSIPASAAMRRMLAAAPEEARRSLRRTPSGGCTSGSAQLPPQLLLPLQPQPLQPVPPPQLPLQVQPRAGRHPL